MNRVGAKVVFLIIMAAPPFFMGVPSAQAKQAAAPRGWKTADLARDLIQFQPWRDAAPPGAGYFSENLSLPQPPSHGLFGHIDLSDVETKHYPLTLTIFYGKMTLRDLAGQKSAVTVWGDPQGLTVPLPAADAPQMRYAIGAATGAARIPVWGVPTDYQHDVFNRSAWSVWAEVRDAYDRLVAYRRLIDAYSIPYGTNLAPMAYTTNDPEAERFFQDRNLHGASRQIKLPLDWPFYARTRALWMSRGTFNPNIPRAAYRRMLLGGTALVGRPDIVDEVAAAAGVAAGAAVLNAAVLSSSDPENPLKIPLMPSESSYYNPLSTPTLVPGAALGKAAMTGLRSYTLAGLGVYAVAMGLVLVVGFAVLKGQKRLRLWLAVPALSIAAALLLWFLAPYCVDFTSKARATEYEYSYGDWPESYRQTQLSALTFGHAPFVWELPAGAQLFQSEASHGLRGFSKDASRGYLMTAAPAKTTVKSPARRGQVTALAAGLWGPSEPPVKMLEGGRWQFLESFDTAWLWTGAIWKNAGAVKAGQTVDPDPLPTLFEMSYFDIGASQEGQGYLGALSHPLFDQLPARVRLLSDPRWLGMGRMKTQAVLIGLKKNKANAQPAWKKPGALEATYVRIHGFPIKAASPPPKPARKAKGGRS
jgi:hypothetical protein